MPTPALERVNLGVGVYYDEDGKSYLYCVQCRRLKKHAFLSIAGTRLPPGRPGAFDDQAVQTLLLVRLGRCCNRAKLIRRAITGRTGALKLAQDFPLSLGWTSAGRESAAFELGKNHLCAVRGACRFEVVELPYYNPTTHGVDLEGHAAGVSKLMPEGSVVLDCSRCCHRPGLVRICPVAAEWTRYIECTAPQHVPSWISPIRGFGDNLQDDALPCACLRVRPGCLLPSSFSNSFSLYARASRALTFGDR